MSDPHYQHPAYPPYAPPSPGATPGAATFYAPPESLYQNPPYDYDPQQPAYTQPAQLPPPASPYASQYDLSQTVPRAALAQPPAPSAPSGQMYLSPESAAAPPPRGAHAGSSAEYYNQYDDSLPPPSSPRPSPADAETDRSTANKDEGDRSLGGTLVGGAAGYYLGHKRSHGLLGAVGVRVGVMRRDGGDGIGIITTITIIMDTIAMSMDMDIGIGIIGRGPDIVVIVGLGGTTGNDEFGLDCEL
ncbi:conserved histidine-rich protein [Aspergillus terreus]|uniref:Conserved histidine-rich protein n=1 Tax=Aspergillus terreus TaxID=33178 RepID=A0A5M3YRT0_ASPTE|nr:hypothetical protein ATETN484_0003033200 [Aspergillus terreus]GFF14321.1 conserved histidine-rich protein [Aspergillus terreus]